MQLHPKQQAAVLHAEGPAMVVAGPGSGKTAVLTRRIDRLIRGLHVPPEKIMVITFTRAAAEEMKSRFQAFPEEAEAPVFFATFHAAFYHILRREEGLSAGSVLSSEEKIVWLKDMLKDEEGCREQDFLFDLSSEMAAVKAKGLPPAGYQAKCCPSALFQRVYAEYEDRLRAGGRVDFEDMLVRTLALLKEKPEVLSVWQDRFPYILVDEFQDINRLQYEILKLLAEPRRNLFVVGDDDQSIYSFRGAEPEIMADFPKDYPEAARYELFGCWRCAPQILKPCSALISHNRKRFPKELFSLAGKGTKPEINMYADRRAEHAALCEAIGKLRGKGIPYRDMALLCRTNFDLGGLAGVLRRCGIPYQSREKLRDPHAGPEAGDLFAYLELAAGDLSRRHFLRIANRPLRYLPRAAFDEDPVDPAKLLRSLSGHSRQREAAEELLYRLAVLSKMKPFAAVSYVRNEMGYDAWLKQQKGEGAEAALETLDLLQEESVSFGTHAEWKAYIDESRKEAAEEALRGGNASPGSFPADGEGEGAVSLVTMHGAKGLEYEAVFLPDVIEGNIPHRKSLSPDALEEERRLFYVAMTRAKRYLWIGWIRRDRAGKCLPSRFIREMDR